MDTSEQEQGCVEVRHRDNLHASERAQHERLFRYSEWDTDDAGTGLLRRRVIPLSNTLNAKTEVQACLGVMERGWESHVFVDYGRVFKETGGNTREYQRYVEAEEDQRDIAEAWGSLLRRYGRSGRACSCGRANCLLAEPRLGLSNCLGSAGTPWDREPNPIEDPGLSREASRRMLAACGAVE